MKGRKVVCSMLAVCISGATVHYAVRNIYGKKRKRGERALNVQTRLDSSCYQFYDLLFIRILKKLTVFTREDVNVNDSADKS